MPALAGAGNVGMLPRRRKKMKIGDTVRVVVSGRYCEVTEVPPGHGFCYVEFLDDGSEGTFTLDELELINESR